MALMVDRVQNRIAFGKPLAEQGVVQQQIALSRNEIDQSRLLCHKAAWTIDQHGNKSREARQLVAMIKAVAPQMACNVIDRAIQVHGAAGISDDTVLARLYGWHRAMRLFDGPDEVHMRTIARAELGREKSAFAAAVTRSSRSADALSGAWNFRDVAEETGIRPGRFFRSSELSGLDDAGREALAGFGITDVADLRSEREVERHGSGLVPDGVVIHRLPFHELCQPDAEAPHEQRFQRMMTEKPDDEDRRRRRRPLHDRGVRAASRVARRASRCAAGDLDARRRATASSTHCFAGKDRTGFTVAVVLEAVGVDRDAIMADFLRSNDAVPGAARQHPRVDSQPDEETTAKSSRFAEARLTDEVLGVREAYLDTARRTIDDDLRLAGRLPRGRRA